MNNVSKIFGLSLLTLAAFCDVNGTQRHYGGITRRLHEVSNYLQDTGVQPNAVALEAGMVLNCGDMSAQLRNCLAIRENNGRKYLVLNLARTNLNDFNNLLERNNAVDNEMSCRIAGGIDELRNMVLQNTVALFRVHQDRNRYNELQGYLADYVPRHLVNEANEEVRVALNAQMANH